MSDHEVRVMKMEEHLHYSWHPTLIFNKNDFRMTAWSSPRELHHHSKNSIFTFNNNAIELFWRNLPFSIGLSYDNQTDIITYYCNIHLPCVFQNNKTTFVDLDLDVVKKNNEPAKTIDWDDFKTNGEKYKYNNEILNKVPQIAKSLEALLDNEMVLQPKELKKLFQSVFENNKINKFKEENSKSFLHIQKKWSQNLLLTA